MQSPGFAAGVPAAPSDPVGIVAPLSPLHRAYFVCVALFAVWVGLWGTFAPAQVAMALPWSVPPLHARVIGAMYLSGFVLMAVCALRSRADEVAVGLRMATVWTAMLLAASLLHLAQFEPANPRVWFWFFAYVAFPLAGAWLAWRDRPALRAAAAAAELSGAPERRSAMVAMRAALAVFGLGFCLLAVALFVLPTSMLRVWPWKASELLLQIYAGPCLSLGIGGLLLTRPRHANEIGTATAGMATFLALVLVASLLHRALFDPGRLATAVWFGALAVSCAILVAIGLGRRASAAAIR